MVLVSMSRIVLNKMSSTFLGLNICFVTPSVKPWYLFMGCNLTLEQFNMKKELGQPIEHWISSLNLKQEALVRSMWGTCQRVGSRETNTSRVNAKIKENRCGPIAQWSKKLCTPTIRVIPITYSRLVNNVP